MARPTEYDDRQLLELTAEILAWPGKTGVRTKDEAMRQAISYIPGANDWPADKQEKIVARLKKSYAKCGAQLEAAARGAPRRFPGPYLPPPLLNTPTDPKIARARSEAHELVDGLRHVAEWATELADILWRQSWRDAVHADLRAHARDLIRIVKKEEDRATAAEKNPDS